MQTETKTKRQSYYVEVVEVIRRTVLVRTDEEPTEAHLRDLLEAGRYEVQETNHERFEEIGSVEAE